jgi:hypothetical protein
MYSSYKTNGDTSLKNNFCDVVTEFDRTYYKNFFWEILGKGLLSYVLKFGDSRQVDRKQDTYDKIRSFPDLLDFQLLSLYMDQKSLLLLQLPCILYLLRFYL